MIRLVILCLAFFCSYAYAETVRVTGIGNTSENARYDGFRKAIESVLGSLVFVEKQSQNSKLTKNDILLQSAGYVEFYRIVSENRVGPDIVIVMDVKVARSKLIDGFLVDTRSKELSGEQVLTPYATFMENKNRANKFLSKFLESYPEKAYHLRVGNTALKHDGYGNGIIQIPYIIEFNQQWVNGFEELIKYNSDLDTGFATKFMDNLFKYDRPRSLGEINIKRRTYHFHDKFMVKNIIDTIHGTNTLQLNVTFIDDDKTLYSACYTPVGVNGGFYQIDGNTFTLNNTNVRETYWLDIKIEYNSQLMLVLNKTKKINVALKPYTECEKNKITY